MVDGTTITITEAEEEQISIKYDEGDKNGRIKPLILVDKFINDNILYLL